MSLHSLYTNRSSSIIADAQSHSKPEDLIKTLSEPNGEIAQLINRSNQKGLCLVVQFLYRGNAIIDKKFDEIFELTKSKIRENSNDQDYQTYMKQLSLTITQAIFDSGKIDPALAALLRRETESTADFNTKCARVSAVINAKVWCNTTIEKAAQAPKNERIEMMKSFIGGECMKDSYQKWLNYLGFDESSILETFSMFPSLLKEVLAVGVADTIGRDFAKVFGELIATGKPNTVIDEWLSHQYSTPTY